LSNLQGLAQYHEHSTAFEIPLSSFSILVNIICCMRLIAHHMVLVAAEEYHHFIAFSKWLRHIIEVQNADPTSAAGDDVIEKDPGADYLSVFSYIRTAFEQSKIEQYLSSSHETSNIKANPNMYDDLKMSLKRSKDGKSHAHDSLKLTSYYSEWRKHNESLIAQITNWQRKTTLMPGALVLSNEKLTAYDVRMVSEVCIHLP
jgi:anaphase-promoting complex subunit 4